MHRPSHLTHWAWTARLTRRLVVGKRSPKAPPDGFGHLGPYANHHKSAELQRLIVAASRMLAAHDADVAAGSLMAGGNGVAADQLREALNALSLRS